MEYPLFQEDIEILKFSHYPYLPESFLIYAPLPKKQQLILEQIINNILFFCSKISCTPVGSLFEVYQ